MAAFDTCGDRAIAVAYQKYGCRLREIAEYLGVHYAWDIPIVPLVVNVLGSVANEEEQMADDRMGAERCTYGQFSQHRPADRSH